jgi:hypothetical protein
MVVVVSGPEILVGAKSFTKLDKQLIGFITTQKVDIITIDHETSWTSDGSDTKFGQPLFSVYKQSVHVINYTKLLLKVKPSLIHCMIVMVMVMLYWRRQWWRQWWWRISPLTSSIGIDTHDK